MKDTIISLDNGVNYYILDELNYFENYYVVGAMMDMSKMTIDDENLVVKRLIKENGEQRIESIEDPVEAEAVTKIIFSKLHSEQ
ncbi:MAG: DUF1292 domain-containing protein [Bacilli bacterium]|nr:DUF1292 domain-containing protein [Bacilli bacterium]